VERHLATNNPADDKLAPFRQQAAIIARKKETTAEQLTELKNKLSAAEEELQVKYSTVTCSRTVANLRHELHCSKVSVMQSSLSELCVCFMPTTKDKKK
jgi:hypothetical protein